MLLEKLNKEWIMKGLRSDKKLFKYIQRQFAKQAKDNEYNIRSSSTMDLGSLKYKIDEHDLRFRRD